MSEDGRDVIRPEIIDYSVDGIRLHRPVVDPSLEFVLGVGTPAEQALQWPDGWPQGAMSEPMLSQWWSHTDDQLRRLRTHFAEPNKGRSQNICLVDGIWLVWCYASTDIKNLYLQVAQQSDEIANLQATIKEMEQTIARFGRAIGELRQRVTDLDGIAP